MKKLNKYSKYSEATRQKMAKVEAHLKEKYGSSVAEVWDITLDTLALNLDLLEQLEDSIRTHGAMYDDGTGLRRNQAVVSLATTTSTIAALTKSLGLTPYAAQLLKNNAEEEAEDFVKNLTK